MSDLSDRLREAAPASDSAVDLQAIRKRARELSSRRRLAVGATVVVVLLTGLATRSASRSDSPSDARPAGTMRTGEDNSEIERPPGARGFYHWHVAYGVYACDEYLPFLEDPGRDPHGIHTHGDGVIHVHPFDRQGEGATAKLSSFEELVGVTFDENRIYYDGKAFETGDDCNGTPGDVRFLVNGKERAGDPSSYRFRDCDVIVVAFAEPGSVIPPLPWASTLTNLSDMPPPTCESAAPATQDP